MTREQMKSLIDRLPPEADELQPRVIRRYKLIDQTADE